MSIFLPLLDEATSRLSGKKGFFHFKIKMHCGAGRIWYNKKKSG